MLRSGEQFDLTDFREVNQVFLIDNSIEKKSGVGFKFFVEVSAENGGVYVNTRLHGFLFKPPVKKHMATISRHVTARETWPFSAFRVYD